MAFDVGAIFGKVKLDTSEFRTAVGQVTQGSQSMATGTKAAGLGFSGLWKQVAAGLGITMGIIQAIRFMKDQFADTIQKGREFEREWANVTTMITDASVNTDKMRLSLLGLSSHLGSATELAKGMYQVLSASIEPSQAIKFLGEAAKAAEAGLSDVFTSVDALTTVINAYGMRASDVTEISDIMFQTVKRGKLTYSDLAGALGTVVPIASQVGIKFTDLAAGIATMTRQGINAQTATMMLRQILNSVIGASVGTRQAAKDMGIEFDAASLKAKGLGGFLQYVYEKTDGNVEKMKVLFPNIRALGGVMALTGEAAKGFAFDLELMRKASGSTEEAFQKQMQSMDFWLEAIKNGIDKMKIHFYEGFIAQFREGIRTSKDLDLKMRELEISAHNLGREFSDVVKYVADFGKAVWQVATKGGPVGGLTERLVDFSYKLVGAKNMTEALREAQLKHIETLEKLNWALDKGGKIADDFKNYLKDFWEWLNKVYKRGKDAGGVSLELLATLEELGIKTKTQLNVELTDLIDTIEKLRKSGVVYDGQLKELAEKAVELAEITGRKLSPEIINLTKSKKELSKEAETLIKKLETYKSVLGDLAKEYGEGKISLTEYFEKWREHRKHTEEAINDLQNLELAQEDYDQFVVEDTQDTWDQVLEIIGVTSQKAFEEAREHSRKAAREIKADWEDVGEAFKIGFMGFEDPMMLLVDAAATVGNALNQAFVDVVKGSKSVGEGIADVIKSMEDFAGRVSPLLGAIVGGFRTLLGIKTKAEKEAEAAAKAEKAHEHWIKSYIASMTEYGEVSEETAEKIKKAAEKMTGFAAESKYFADIISDVGVTQENVNELWWRAGEILGHYQRGFLSAGDAAEAASDSFELLLEGAKKLDEEGSAAMVDFILKVRESGLEVQSVTEYVIGQLDRIPTALTAQIEAWGKNENTLRRLGETALHTFNAMIASGVSWTEAVEKMADPLAALRDKYEELGLTADPALQKLFEIIGITEKHKELFTAIDANREIMEALGNSGWMTSEILGDLAQNAKLYYQRLLDTGMSADDALRMMGPTLQDLFDYAQAYGIQLDANTQSLVDQAMELGIVKDKKKEEIEAQEALFKGLGDRIEGIMGKVGENICTAITSGFNTAFGNAEVQAVTTAGNVENTVSGIAPIVDIGFKYNIPDFSNLTGNVNVGFTTPKFAGNFQRGGVIEAGPHQPTGFIFGEGEEREQAVIKRMGGAGQLPDQGGGGIHIHGPLISTRGIAISDLEAAGEELKRIIEDQLRRRGITL